MNVPVNVREIVLEAVRKHGCNLWMYPEYSGDREIVLAAVTNHGHALRDASVELRNDREIVLTAITQNCNALRHASDQLCDDREFVLAAVTKCGDSLRFASDSLINNRETVLAAVINDGCALRFASAELRGDREIVLAAVTNNGHSIYYASYELRRDRSVVFTAMINQPEDKFEILAYASKSLRNCNWLKCKPGKTFKRLVQLQIKYTRQDTLYKSWLHPDSVYMRGYFETDNVVHIPEMPLFLASVLKKRKEMELNQ